jgi:hypothetical protein
MVERVQGRRLFALPSAAPQETGSILECALLK